VQHQADLLRRGHAPQQVAGPHLHRQAPVLVGRDLSVVVEVAEPLALMPDHPRLTPGTGRTGLARLGRSAHQGSGKARNHHGSTVWMLWALAAILLKDSIIAKIMGNDHGTGIELPDRRQIYTLKILLGDFRCQMG